MIYRYELKEIDNEKVLYLYCDFKHDFGTFWPFNSFLERIHEFIKINAIPFNGTAITIVTDDNIFARISLAEDFQKELSNFR